MVMIDSTVVTDKSREASAVSPPNFAESIIVLTAVGAQAGIVQPISNVPDKPNAYLNSSTQQSGTTSSRKAAAIHIFTSRMPDFMLADIKK